MSKSTISSKKLARARMFNRFASWITHKVGSPAASVIALSVVIVWAVLGPVFKFSDTWQLVINTGTTIVTFLMVFIIQQSQNKDTTAVHLKLNELIACNEKASNRLVEVEDLTEEELRILRQFYVKLSKQAEKDKDLHSSHSLDEAEENHKEKLKKIKPKTAGK